MAGPDTVSRTLALDIEVEPVCPECKHEFTHREQIKVEVDGEVDITNIQEVA